jgi:hypothetical protein
MAGIEQPQGPKPTPTPAQRWPARFVCTSADLAGEVCVTVWPTRHLRGPTRWFDEMYAWAEGIEPNSEQWSRIQLFVLERGLQALAQEQAEQVGVTLSYSTVQRCDEQIDALLRAHALVAHRLVVMLRGSIDSFTSHFRIRAVAEYLRTQRIPVGVRVTAPRLAMDLNAFSVVQPDFAKILAPAQAAAGAWDAMALEARFAGISERWLIAAGLQSQAQVQRAAQAGIGFGQGAAVRPARRPRATRGGRLAAGGESRPAGAAPEAFALALAGSGRARV